MELSNHRIHLDELISLIERNGGPANLDLRRANLEGCDLSRDAVLQRRAQQHYKRRPPWQNSINGGLNLRGAILVQANLFGTNLSFVDLSDANLQEAHLQAINLSNARLHNANFYKAKLNHADMSNAVAFRARFDNADMSNSNLAGSNFDEASFKNASLYHARLSGTLISRKEVGDILVQEKRDRFMDFLLEHHADAGQTTIRNWVDRRQYEDARQIYATLKANFLSIGNYDDASWAHIKERQMEKKTHHPRNVRRYYQNEMPDTENGFFAKRWKLYLTHTLQWILASLSEITIGYGEKPLRAVAWAVVILLVFPLIFRASG